MLHASTRHLSHRRPCGLLIHCLNCLLLQAAVLILMAIVRSTYLCKTIDGAVSMVLGSTKLFVLIMAFCVDTVSSSRSMQLSTDS